MGRKLITNKFLIFSIISFLSFQNQAMASGSGITYNGRLLDPSGNAVTSSNVQFRIQIRTPGNENCLMYEEIQTKDMTNSDGIFSITINDGSGTRTDSTGFTLDQLFANRGSFAFPASYCVTGSNYAPNATDGRKLQVYFNDGSFATGQWEPTPSMAINFIPMAIESQQVGGYKKEQLIKIADGVSTTGTELDSTKWTNLLALINGTSTAYTKPTDQVTQLYGATVPVPANGQSIRWNSALNSGTGGWENFTAGSASAVTSVSSANSDIAVANGGTTPQLTLNSGTGANQIVKLDGTAKLPAVDGSALTNVNASKVGGTTVSLASLTSGQVLKYNGTNWVNVADSDTLGGLSCANGRVAYYTGGDWACLEVTSANTVNTIVSRDASGVSNFGTVNTGTLKINDGATGAISLTTPVAVTSYSMRLPATVGTAGYALTTDGGSPAQLSWSPMTSSQWTTTGSDIYYNTGKVGIGTTAPAYPLQVAGTTRINDVGIGMGGDQIGNVAGNTLFINYNLGDVAMVQGSGKVGVGIYTAGSKLSVQGNMSVGATYAALAGPTSGAIFEGNVGIGTSSPLAGNVLHVKGANATANQYMMFESNCSGCSTTGVKIFNSAIGNGNKSSLFFETGADGGGEGVYGLIDGIRISNTAGALAFSTTTAGSVTEKARIDNNGNMAIGRSTASAKLDVQGQIVSRSYDNGAGVAFDMNNGNAQYTSASCGAMTMSNLVDGASYTLVVQGATSGTCTFTASGYTFRFNPANGPTTASSHTIYSMQVIGSIVYVSWITGF